MGTEIERKFLVDPARLPAPEKRFTIAQGYLNTENLTVRVRIQNDSGFLTLKGHEAGIARTEFEYPIPLSDARQMLDRLALPGIIEKERLHYHHAGNLWEVDVFSGENEGLVLAEVELDSANQEISIPDWGMKEVSGDKRYFNAYLARHPFRHWPK